MAANAQRGPGTGHPERPFKYTYVPTKEIAPITLRPSNQSPGITRYQIVGHALDKLGAPIYHLAPVIKRDGALRHPIDGNYGIPDKADDEINNGIIYVAVEDLDDYVSLRQIEEYEQRPERDDWSAWTHMTTSSQVSSSRATSNAAASEEFSAGRTTSSPNFKRKRGRPPKEWDAEPVFQPARPARSPSPMVDIISKCRSALRPSLKTLQSDLHFYYETIPDPRHHRRNPMSSGTPTKGISSTSDLETTSSTTNSSKRVSRYTAVSNGKSQGHSSTMTKRAIQETPSPKREASQKAASIVVPMHLQPGTSQDLEELPDDVMNTIRYDDEHEEEDFELSNIVDDIITEEGRLYEVTWKGYEETSWLPENAFDDAQDLLQEYLQSKTEKMMHSSAG